MLKRSLLIALLALPATTAHAFTEPDSGGWFGVGGGLALGDANPLSAGAGWQATAGLWFGKHDAVYAFGKYTGIGVTVRQSLLGDALQTEPMLEIRRGADIVVVTTQLFASAGPLLREGDIGVSMLVGGGVKYRLTPYFGITGRLEAGATYIDTTWGFRSNVVLGLEYAGPWSGRRE